MTPQRTKRAPVPRQGRRAARGQQPPRGPKPGPAREEGPQRIAKLLARAGVASRRDIERMIAEGRIALNGEKLTTPATLLENLQGVTVDGQPVKPPGAARLFLFYKPAGCLTAARDPKGTADDLRQAAAGPAAADARWTARLYDRRAAAAHQRWRVEAAA